MMRLAFMSEVSEVRSFPSKVCKNSSVPLRVQLIEVIDSQMKSAKVKRIAEISATPTNRAIMAEGIILDQKSSTTIRACCLPSV